MTSPSSAAAFDALAIVVRDRGIGIAEDPARLRGMLNDVLAADARVNRAAVDALVIAAEEGIPRDLASTTVPDPAVLSARLAGRGVGPELAHQTLQAWVVAAQGGRTAPAPIPPTELPATKLPPPPGPPGAAMPLAAAVGATVLPPTGGDTFESTSPSADDAHAPTAAQPIAPVVVPPPPPAPAGADGGEGGLPRRTLIALVAAVVAAIALIGGFLLFSGGGDDGSALADATTTTTPPSTTSTTEPGEVPLDVLAPAAGTEVSARETELSGTTEPGASVTVGGVAATVDAAGNWKHTVALPNAENTFSIVVSTPEGRTRTIEWTVKRDAVAPALEILDPVDGSTMSVRDTTLSGTTEPGTTVLVDGAPVGGNPATSNDTTLGWIIAVTIEGDQKTFTVTATDAAGNVTTKAVTLRYQANTTTTRRLPIPCPPNCGPTTTPAPPPPPPAKTFVVRDDGPYGRVGSAGQPFSIDVLYNDPSTAGYTRIEWTQPTYGTVSKGSAGNFTYTLGEGSYTDSFRYRLINDNTGEVSDYATVTINVNL
jgi:hypothetical protein